jgi:acetyl-CoA acetyltransferase family protein
MAGTVIVGGARTPIGKLSGSLKNFTAMDLGGIAIAAAMANAGTTGDQVDHVIMGHVIQAGAGQATARQAAVKGGIPMTVPALTVNKVCLSGLNAIALADQLIGCGEFDVVVAGGMESMTNGPYLLQKARGGYRYGDSEIIDATAHDALFCSFDKRGMGASTDVYSAAKGISRAEQDDYAAMSHDRATTAHKNGLFDPEITSVPVPQRKADPLLVTEDEGVRPGTTAESLATLRPAFGPDGTVTAGNASQLSDGAAAVVVMSRAMSERLGSASWPRSAPTGPWPVPTRRCCRSRPTPSPQRWAASICRRPTSTSSRSTRRSPRWPSSRCATWEPVRPWSTSTAGRSPWAIPSARPVPASRCTSPSNSAGAAAASVQPPCVVVAVRARPCCSVSMPDSGHTPHEGSRHG